MNTYTSPDGYFKDINAVARGDTTRNGVPMGQETIEYYQEVVVSLDKSLSQFTLEREMTFHRFDGLSRYSQKKPGDTIPVKHFWSASAGIAVDFANTEDRVHFEIHVPAGKYGAYLGDNSEVKKEKEFLLRRNLNYKVLEIIPGGGFNGLTRMVLEVIP